MECAKMQIDWEAYVDGEMEREQADRLARHLEACAGCRAELAAARSVVDALDTWPVVSESARLTDSIMARVKSPPALPPFRIRWRDLGFGLVSAGAGFILLVVWGYMVTSGMGRLYGSKLSLIIEGWRLDLLLLSQQLARSGFLIWGALLTGGALAALLMIALNLALMRRRTSLV